MQLVNIGFGNIVSAQRIVAIVSPESAPIKAKRTYFNFETNRNQIIIDKEQLILLS